LPAGLLIRFYYYSANIGLFRLAGKLLFTTPAQWPATCQSEVPIVYHSDKFQSIHYRNGHRGGRS
jgi:hypothetical protein